MSRNRNLTHEDKLAALGCVSGCGVLLGLLILLAVIAVGLLCGCSTVEVSEPEQIPAYTYDGPDGTLTGVPYPLKTYVIPDHDTGVYYFLVLDPQTRYFDLETRYNPDGTPWTMPTYEERGV